MKHRQNNTFRMAGIIAAIVLIIGGVTFAALQSQQNTIAGNTIETATANMQLSINGSSYANTQPGFYFGNIIPGGPAVPETGSPFYLKNSGGTPLALKLAVSGQLSNPDHVDLSKVNVILTPVMAGSSAQSFTLQSLISSYASGGLPINSGNLAAGTTQMFKIQVSMAADAISGSGASLANIDFSLTGTAVSN